MTAREHELEKLLKEARKIIGANSVTRNMHKDWMERAIKGLQMKAEAKK